MPIDQTTAGQPIPVRPVPPEDERFTGCLLAAACGDALSASSADGEDASTLSPLRYTDHTVLALALADHLASRDDPARAGLDQDGLARDLTRAWHDDSARGYDAAAVRVFLGVENGIPWHRTAEAVPGPNGSEDDAAVPALPAGLLSLPMNRLAGVARAAAQITHGHPGALDGAAVQACAVAYALRAPADRPLAVTHLVTTVGRYATTPEFRSQLSRLGGLLREPYTPADVARELGHGACALDVVPAALAAFVRSPDDVAETVRFAVAIGGGSAVASLAGGLAGVRCGEHAIPTTWLDQLEGRQRISAVARALHRGGETRSNAGPSGGTGV
ncbi:ADP-ribosylglycohydrolase [Nocardiopsis sp. Huas11]|uniref:ADP-ribosylglycohydrolase family protein n=1 Tax=Nocardiopsis sp. Huas11 TaxID=2183912 RepID=UPI000EB1C2FF|nr:ADP-ribosylglycohydrolase family protein [Nocardiopsis sp. Huas11]RKS08398.1 ADP-ribosylglycohydrolase [Nocardiopsis sp. Huas11]